MRPSERLAIYSAIAVAILLALGSRNAGTPALALQGGQPANARIASVDAYIVTERLMGTDELKKARETLSNDWVAKLRAIETDFADIDKQIALLTQNDPKYQELAKKAQQKQQDYQQSVGQRDQEIEKLNSSQLISCHQRVVEAVKELASKGGYTHVFTTRPSSRPIMTTTVGATLQEMLARPMMLGPTGDDLTESVLKSLKLDSTNLDTPSTPKADDPSKKAN